MVHPSEASCLHADEDGSCCFQTGGWSLRVAGRPREGARREAKQQPEKLHAERCCLQQGLDGDWGRRQDVPCQHIAVTVHETLVVQVRSMAVEAARVQMQPKTVLVHLHGLQAAVAMHAHDGLPAAVGDGLQLAEQMTQIDAAVLALSAAACRRAADRRCGQPGAHMPAVTAAAYHCFALVAAAAAAVGDTGRGVGIEEQNARRVTSSTASSAAWSAGRCLPGPVHTEAATRGAEPQAGCDVPDVCDAGFRVPAYWLT